MEIRVPDWLEKFAAANESPIYLVGGYVRNVIGGLPPSDIDIAGRPMPEKLTLPHGFFFATTYKRMGTALIKHRYRKDVEMEYTPFRTEEYAPGGGHTPVAVRFDADVESDALRRDFTVNSIYYDIKRKKLVDLFGGVKDIEKRIMRAHDPERVFSSDGLRLMRLVRIAAETGFGIERATADEAARRAPLLADITVNRKRDELLKILKADTVYGVDDAHYRGLKLLRDLGFLKYVIPELAELDGLEQPGGHHKYDALEHTFRTVRVCPPELRLAALLHDVGKAEAVRRNGSMRGHEEIGAEIAARALGPDGFKLPSRAVARIERLVRWHMYDGDGKTRDGKMLVFTARNSDIIDDLSMLIEADRAARGTGEEPQPVRFAEFTERLKETCAPMSLSELRINGADLMSIGYEGPAIGEKLEELFAMCVLDPQLNKHKKLMRVARGEPATPPQGKSGKPRKTAKNK